MPNGNYFFSMTCFYHSVTENSQVTMIENHKKTEPGYLDFLNIFKFLALNFVACRNLFTFLSISKLHLKFKYS